MSILHIVGGNLKNLEPLFENWNETLIWSCLKGVMGTAWADSSHNPRSGQLVIADFCFFAGIASREMVEHKPREHKSDFIIMVPQDAEWEKLIKEVYGDHAVRVSRYAIKKEPGVFDIEMLKKIVENLDKEYELKLIDEEIYRAAKEEKWSADLCSQFENYEEYQEKGLGAAALHNGILVAGASSYTVYDGGIEIEIDTRQDYRRKGLALACGARLILECVKRDLYPSWDAHNKGSVALSQRLGYHFDKEYTAYEVSRYGVRK